MDERKPEPRPNTDDDGIPTCSGVHCRAFYFDSLGSRCTLSMYTSENGDPCWPQLRIDYAELVQLRSRAQGESQDA